MVVKAIYRFVDWVLQLDTSGSPPIFEMKCMGCDAVSGAFEDPAPAQNWALKHAGREGTPSSRP
ncbi:hypothetical protein ADK70_06525 [Streptomyces rimosus subsp. pseudoverticillatus]|uniref:DUF7848 domain-containing protein n=1 Tax=Streptomyces rimosus TaxID=1927 RepID=UPI0006B2649A|nr:hypothetical protein [Streptomyces rimosus]KOT98689.1 hypothetical protein ADK70_06525 [Streptomyces rimosus subsp. pseudoverticillatus]